MNQFIKILMEYSRKYENEVNDQILDAKPVKSNSISKLIDDTFNSHHDVWLMTDWHLFKYDKNTKAVYHNPRFNNIITNCQRYIKPNDLLIFLGDICDGEVERKKDIESALANIPGVKILIRGNNDLFDDSWYLKNGFKYIVPKFVYNDILFTHRPQDNDYSINIHGHIHGSARYYASEITHYNNQIDVAYFNGREIPIKLNDIINKLPEYKKKVVFVDKAWKDDPRIDGQPS